jgi:hypothetical protein
MRSFLSLGKIRAILCFLLVFIIQVFIFIFLWLSKDVAPDAIPKTLLGN